jgi:purine-binding chemotaxis protein CheW
MKGKLAPAGIDWNGLKGRLLRLEQALERNGEPSAEQARAILKARARELARRPLALTADAGIQVIRFLLAHESYAVDSTLVREVTPLKDLTPLPCTPAFVLGIVNLRGEIVSVIDLKRFFNLPPAGITDLNQLIVLSDESMTFGILADRVLGVGALSTDAIEPAPPLFAGIGSEYLKGIGPDRIILLDAAKLLADPALVVRETVAAA